MGRKYFRSYKSSASSHNSAKLQYMPAKTDHRLGIKFHPKNFRPVDERRLKPSPIIPELREAEMILVRLAQREEYGREYKGLSEGKELESGSNIIILTPFFYAEANSIRVG
jgi:hypothetical protein